MYRRNATMVVVRSFGSLKPEMRAIGTVIESIADTDATVLIRGRE
jgi:hypothetical protein